MDSYNALWRCFLRKAESNRAIYPIQKSNDSIGDADLTTFNPKAVMDKASFDHVTYVLRRHRAGLGQPRHLLRNGKPSKINFTRSPVHGKYRL